MPHRSIVRVLECGEQLLDFKLGKEMVELVPRQVILVMPAQAAHHPVVHISVSFDESRLGQDWAAVHVELQDGVTDVHSLLVGGDSSSLSGSSISILHKIIWTKMEIHFL